MPNLKTNLLERRTLNTILWIQDAIPQVWYLNLEAVRRLVLGKADRQGPTESPRRIKPWSRKRKKDLTKTPGWSKLRVCATRVLQLNTDRLSMLIFGEGKGSVELLAQWLEQIRQRSLSGWEGLGANEELRRTYPSPPGHIRVWTQLSYLSSTSLLS